MKILALTDIHGNLKDIPKLKSFIDEIDLIVIAGDFTDFGGRSEALPIINELKNLQRPLLAVHGNLDKIEILDLLEEEKISIHGKSKVIEEIAFVGCGGSSKTPMNTPTEYSEEELAQILHDGINNIKNYNQIILICHTPAKGFRDKTFFGMHVGSQTVKDFIETNKPNLLICGHIHEARGSDKTGDTLIINPGPFKKGYFSIIDTEDYSFQNLKI